MPSMIANTFHRLLYAASKKALLAMGMLLMLASCRTAMDNAVPGVRRITIKDVYAEYMLIGDEYVKLQKYDKAIEYYTKTLGDKELYWSAYYKLGRAYALASEWEEAEVVYERLLARDSKNTDLLRSMAYIKGMNGQTGEAMAIYNALLEERDEDETTIVNIATLMLSTLQIDTARIYIDMLKEKFPESKMLDTLGKEMEDAMSADTIEQDSWEEFEKSL